MKIGIISINMYSKGLNFACPLHTFAFQQFLSQQGIDSTVIDYKPIYYGSFDLRHPYDAYAEGYASLIERKKRLAAEGKPLGEILLEIDRIRNLRDEYGEMYHEREIRHDKFQSFIDANYKKTDKCYNCYTLEYQDPGFDCYICATDVIWSLDAEKGFDWGFFLNCGSMNDKYKIAYAASRGVFHGYTEAEQQDFVRMISAIDEISVREYALRDWIRDNTALQVQTVLDPVLLHEGSFWRKLAVKPEEKGYVLLYYVKEKAADTIQNAFDYAKRHHLDVVELSDKPIHQEIDGVRHIVRYDIGPEEWLGYILHADCIFTNSFHACCFSILFEKIFYVGSRKGDKVGQILSTCGLSDRRIQKGISVEEMQEQIDYVSVRKRLQKKREESTAFLLGAIRRGEEWCRKPHQEKNAAEKYSRQQKLQMSYHSGSPEGKLNCSWDTEKGKLYNRAKDVAEYVYAEPIVNDGKQCFAKSGFTVEKAVFSGWYLRVKVGDGWLWYGESGRWIPERDQDMYTADRNVEEGKTPDGKALDGRAPGRRTANRRAAETDGEFWQKLRLFKEGDPIPQLNMNHIQAVTAEARWTVQGINSVTKGIKQAVKERLRAVRDWKNQRTQSDSRRRKLRYELCYYSGKQVEGLEIHGDLSLGHLKHFESGASEYVLNEKVMNDESTHIQEDIYFRKGYYITGWKLRVKSGDTWYWYMQDGTLQERLEYSTVFENEIALLQEKEALPYLPCNPVTVAVLEARWESETGIAWTGSAEDDSQYRNLAYKLHYHSGLKKRSLKWTWDEGEGTILKLDSGAVEYKEDMIRWNNGNSVFGANQFRVKGYQFIGWQLRAKVGSLWCWYLEDMTLGMKQDAEEEGNAIRLFAEGEAVPVLPLNRFSSVVAVAVWEKCE